MPFPVSPNAAARSSDKFPTTANGGRLGEAFDSTPRYNMVVLGGSATLPPPPNHGSVALNAKPALYYYRGQPLTSASIAKSLGMMPDNNPTKVQTMLNTMKPLNYHFGAGVDGVEDQGECASLVLR